MEAIGSIQLCAGQDAGCEAAMTCSPCHGTTDFLWSLPSSTVEPPKKGHFGNGTFVLSSEVVLLLEVHKVFQFYYFTI